MAKQTVAIDIDDVLADSTEALRREVNKRLGTNLSPKHYKVPGDYWEYYENVWQQHGLSDRINMQDLEPRMRSDQSHIQPMEKASEALRKLSRRYHLIVVTGRSSDWKEATNDWLEKHFPRVFSKVIFGDGYESLKEKSKGQLCVENGVSYLIDDNVEHAMSAHEQGIEIILFGDYGWHHKMPPHFTHCKTWSDVLEYFDAEN